MQALPHILNIYWEIAEFLPMLCTIMQIHIVSGNKYLDPLIILHMYYIFIRNTQLYEKYVIEYKFYIVER